MWISILMQAAINYICPQHTVVPRIENDSRWGEINKFLPFQLAIGPFFMISLQSLFIFLIISVGRCKERPSQCSRICRKNTQLNRLIILQSRPQGRVVQPKQVPPQPTSSSVAPLPPSLSGELPIGAQVGGKLADYNLFSVMLYRQAMSIFLIFCMVAVCVVAGGSAHPLDITVGRQYFGSYISKLPGKAFGYLQERTGDILATFQASPKGDAGNSMRLLLLDPQYEDGRTVQIVLRGIVEVDGTSGSWQADNHSLSLSKNWRKRVLQTVSVDRVSSAVLFQNLDSEDYEEVSMTVQMKGEGFDFTAELKFYNQIVPTMLYSLYVSAVVAVQIFSAYMVMRQIEASNSAVGSRFSLLTLAVCNVLDFAQMMTHVELILGSSSGYLFFILPAVAYLCLFVFLEMKMLFLAWKSHNVETLDQPLELRDHITSFYIKFYLGLFGYLTLNYFFAFQGWMVLLKNLVLLPQIAHNVHLGQRPHFNPYYVFGFIGSRLLIPLYEYSCPENRFKIAPNDTLLTSLLVTFACQALILALQSYLGSKFFVPRRLRPNFFDYTLKMTAKEHGEDCAICLQGLLQQPSSSESKPTNIPQTNQEVLAKSCDVIGAMKTPCGHKFHEQCLMQWMDVKLECPTCRSNLPPL